jgi:hypothetical protein
MLKLNLGDQALARRMLREGHSLADVAGFVHCSVEDLLRYGLRERPKRAKRIRILRHG